VAAVDVVDAFLAGLPGARRLAHAGWGITVPAETAGGEPLDVDLTIADGPLRGEGRGPRPRARARPLGAPLLLAG
jgi:hypothetical protein